MGQENQIIALEQYDVEDNIYQRKKIFKNNVNKKPFNQPSSCQLKRGVCSCPSNHSFRNDFKLCSHCIEYPGVMAKNFRSIKPIPYDMGQSKFQKPHKTNFSSIPYKQPKIISEQVPIRYYNAWSLPIQQCYNDNGAAESRTMADTDQYQPIPVRPMIKSPQQPFLLDNIKKDQSIIYGKQINQYEIDGRDRIQRLFMH